MNFKLLNRIFAAVIFLIALIVYLSTVQRTVSFWDCGEFAASAYYLQVPHPPGTPFFLILGRVFSLIPFAENIGMRINMISVVSSAFTIMFLYLVAVKLIENYRKKEYENYFEAISVYVSAAIGALSLAFSYTFWFNSVESEVYAFSTFFIAFVTWLMVHWNERADQPDNEKYLILIAYLIGISTGVHLMSVLAIVSVVMTVVFRKYVTNEETLRKTGIIFVVQSAIILAVALIMWASQTESTPPSFEDYKAIDSRFLVIFIIISVLFVAAMYKKIFQRNSFYIPIIIGGVTLVAVYPGMVKYVPKLISTIGGNNSTLDIIIVVFLFAALGAGILYTSRKGKATLNLVFKCAFFALIGVTTYAMMIIRANQETPINMNSPKTFSELESYLNREQYGDFPTFKRRYSTEPHQLRIFSDYSSDLDFLWNYQINHMFNRYLLWNYAGKESTFQDSNVDITELFAIPLLIGIFGVYHHFRRDWKMASIFLVMFIFLGYLTAFYQNQQQPQPRERDYFYVGAFFVFSIWIALGMKGLLELIQEKFSNVKQLKPVIGGFLLIGLLLVPINMFSSNYSINNRSKNYIPWDYAYNLLQSASPNAVIFTNGDNDTFPLWYLQDVEGVRRDVRVACLSLLNTPWYVKQLKNNSPYGSQKVEMSFTDEEIDNIRPMQWEPRQMAIPVSSDAAQQYSVTDTSVTKSGLLKWHMKNTVSFGDVPAVRVQDIVVLDIIMQSKWKRPVYFAATTSDDGRLNLDDYLQMEGMAMKLVPKKSEQKNIEYINEPLLRKQLMEEPEGYSKTYQPGFKFRSLNDKSIFFDENHERLTQNYRNAFIRLAVYYLYQDKNNQKVIGTLNMMEKRIPRDVIPMDYRIKHDVAKIYYNAGDMQSYHKYAKEVIESAKHALEENPRDYSSWYNPYDMLLTHYDYLHMYNEAVGVLLQLQNIAPNDPMVTSLLKQYKKLAGMDTLETTPQTLEQK